MNESIRRDNDNLEPHPLAALMPMIDGNDRENLKADIAKQGVLVKIVLYAGNADGSTGPLRILDGRNRYSVAGRK
jgi:hypothetical protein